MADPASGLGSLLPIDLFAFRARVMPLLAAAAPLLFLAVLIVWPLLPDTGWRWAITPTLALVLVLAQQWGRDPGRQVQEQLWAQWGGAPTTALLRWRGTTPTDVQHRRHTQLQQLLGPAPILPTAAEELTDQAGSDSTYQIAVRALIARTSDKSRYPHLKAELADYNFRRNLYGLRHRGRLSAGITLVLAAGWALIVTLAKDPPNQLPELVIHLARVGPSAAIGLGPAAVSVIALALWSRATNQWLKTSADTYAETLLNTLEHLSTDPPASGTPPK